MKGFWIVAGLVFAGAIGVILQVRGTDPRPVAAEMRARLTEASAGLEVIDADHGFAGLMAPYHEAAAGMGKVALDYVTDIDIRDFAQRLTADEPQMAAKLRALRDTVSPSTGLGTLQDSTRVELAAGIAHIGTPDEIFVRTMLALHEGSVAVAETALAESEDAGLRAAAEDIVLLHKSAIGSMNRWLNDNQHAH